MLVQKPGTHYDVIVIGAGMVGASFALALRRSLPGRNSVLVVEAARTDPGQSSSPSFDDRSTALSFGSSRILQQIDLWPGLVDQITPIHRIHVSDRGHFGSALLDRDSEGVAALGYVVENRHFGQLLNQALQDQEGLDFLAPARVDSIVPGATGMSLRLLLDDESPAEVTAGLVVLADGGRSPICEKLGIGMVKQHYGQRAIIANIGCDRNHDNVAYERFTDSGPMAVLPLQPRDGVSRGALIWTVAEADADAFMALAEQELIRILQERFGFRLGRIVRIGQRACYPLSLQIAREQIRPGLVLLGNVAHTLHPVAGQGFNLALRDASELVSELTRAVAAGRSPGDMQVLQRFQNRQQGDQDRTIGFSHYLTRLFSNNRSGLIWARKFGLASIDLVPIIRHEFARSAMGLADR
ncbi:MAG: 2-octaprenyl-6-methoxyphenyl hydroxylase [Gammaproteobacteria bacterium]|nr:2-octaprenyl-6-methoxyphenyl hydroxylase [Pseudomonadales bacterium]MCP5348138.1 2-octaprenyl-6-methoxyphenyl hydroxylase [Pseudomonadales bacterium]